MKAARITGVAAALAALVLTATGCGGGTGSATARDDTAASDAAQAAPAAAPEVYDFAATTIDGAGFEGSSLAGKPTVVWFWAPWCPTCRAQISGVSELAATYGDAVNVVGVGSLDAQEAIEDFAADVSPAVTLLADPDGEVWRHFGVTAQSTYLVLDEAGAEQASGSISDEDLAAMVEDLAG